MFATSGSTIGRIKAASYALVPVSCPDAPYASPRCNGRAKRIFDILVAAVALVIFGIPMLISALLIWLDSPGPILFRQIRTGYANIGFETLKFRTMRDDAGAARGRLRQATRNDPRCTLIGAWMRRWSIDELPQLFNVLRGEMSLVGPRPHAPGTCAGGKPFEMVTPLYRARHRVRPGITGLAQVRGLRGETETEDKLLHRVDADLEYIEHWSLWLDVVILARTVTAVFHNLNAY